ncbi:PREDICTED: Y+L amino acid transporter 2-like isoform X2 [Priapulus caudatus]|uniref:Y+L amino acid transporter 2-like isoform X1 n=1 Tax=Priapulus caudatus TaxID=37621 RepID=A0ABM1EJ21_PRICU|nr:PREDICTED: Y+L amino acid transporter 2-like isoform X1 [Priapulus caudatus]XP_014672188.1 PREDICTED: Y+L amino acid transporter 2-like isoform X1 [Priapulus caudatus]XP_014672189.1 PREDICTED: Y+L amino acid transporter 2-like isoform X1 [Priapulus caudatus]XP_014672191.1 PREDICTED: Y+L amino acid transporter 2-like isoform X2 [Priapulus caudatus]XP_014672192.1 PREDICTED: Y+L amino acid transporter 2-like isoform X2 [Priapulus caudatus]
MHEDEEEEDSCTGAQSTQQHGDFYVNEQHHVLHKSVGLLRAVALVTGAVIGAGIFTTPKNVLAHAGSPGMALAVWFGCGIFTLLGVLCYAELGLMVPKSGGQYQYLRLAFGPLSSFMFLWSELWMRRPLKQAIVALTIARYSTLFHYWQCVAPPAPCSERMVALCCVWAIVAINSYSVHWTCNLESASFYCKCVALGAIIIFGCVHLAQEPLNFLTQGQAFEGTSREIGSISTALYWGLYAYSGWETLNFATEELKNPKKNLPRALLISMCLVTALFVLTNLAYMLVLPQQELLDTGVVAMAFARQTMGAFAAVMPLLVILSLMGSLNGNIFMGGRVYFAGARDGHQLPELLAMVSVGRITPLPALLLNGMMASLMILFSVGDIDYLHRSYGCWRWIMVAGGAICQIYLRIKRPDLPRPFKVPMMVPVLFLLVCGYLILVPVILEPQLLVVGICIHLLGIPVYYATVIGRGRLFLQGATRKWTLLLQKVLLVALTDSKMPGLKRHRHKKS